VIDHYLEAFPEPREVMPGGDFYFSETITMVFPMGITAHNTMEVGSFEEDKVLFVRRWDNDDEVFSLFHFGEDIVRVGLTLPEGRWDRTLESSSYRWGGDGNYAPEKIDSHVSGVTISCCPYGFVLYRMRRDIDGTSCIHSHFYQPPRKTLA
jgi:hypothetical protein